MSSSCWHEKFFLNFFWPYLGPKMKFTLKIVPRKKNDKKLIINIETESDNDVESETEQEKEPDTETESLCYGECQCESEPLTKENKEKENDANIKFIRKVPTHPINRLKWKAKQLTVNYH